MLSEWPCPRSNAHSCTEFAISFDHHRAQRLLIIPALFDEANKMRRNTIELMRQLDEGGTDSFLPDLPGQNESLERLQDQSLSSWQQAAQAAARHFSATHILAIRGGALLAPSNLPGWLYAPIHGERVLRALVRARITASREKGTPETSEELHAMGRDKGVELAGWSIGPEMFAQLQTGIVEPVEQHKAIAQHELGSSALWLRAQPGEDPAQARALAAILMEELDTQRGDTQNGDTQNGDTQPEDTP